MTAKQDRVLLVDMMNTYIRSWMIINVTNDDGDHFGGVFGFLRSLKAAVDKFKPTEVVIACDGVNGGLRRKKLFPQYKANRKKEWKRGSVKAFDFLDEKEQSENFVMQIERIEEYLKTLPVKVIRIPYVEADDVIAIYVNQLPESSEAVIYSSDADFKQLITDRVCHYNPISKKLLYRRHFINDVGIEPDNYIILKSVQGDKSDNIPGIKGFGEPTLMKLFPEVAEPTRVDLEDMIARANRVGFTKEGPWTPGQRNKFKVLAENADVLRRNFRLMQLRDPEVSTEAVTQICRAVEEDPQPFNSLKLKMMFVQDKLEKTVRRFDDWTHTFAGLQVR